MQITNKFSVVTLIQCVPWMFFLVALSHPWIGINGLPSASEITTTKSNSELKPLETVAAEIISGRPKISYDIKSLSGEPDYKSVNLTWEVEPSQVEVERESTPLSASASSSPAVVPAFQVYYCEMQSWGPQRCKSQVLQPAAPAENEGNHIDETGEREAREFNVIIDNLRMATKYSFRVRQLQASSSTTNDQRAKGRSMNDEEDDMSMNDLDQGQSIIIPTKGFSAHATKCLAHASEIEVETGPFFGGKIKVENSDCIIEGDPASPQSTYTMQIDHGRCGSQVFHNNLTVVTTVVTQENQGIFTHSTRRFLVVCSYQSEMLTVRASFLVPGKGGVETSPEWQRIAQPSRNARERQFKLVGRNALVLKDNDPEREVEEDTGLALLESEGSQYQFPANGVDAENLIAAVDQENHKSHANYLRLIHSDDESFASPNSHSSHRQPNHRESDRLSGVLIAVSLSVIMVGSVVYLLMRESKKQRIAQSQRIIRVAQP